MAKELRVVAYDDRELKANGRKVEAAREDVVLQLGEERVLLDLTEGNYGALRDALKDWLAAGSPPGPAVPAKKPGAKKPGRGRSQPFPEPYYRRLLQGRGLNDAQIAGYLIDLREWADREGRSAEYRQRKDGRPRPGSKWYYPRKLVDAYEASRAKVPEGLAEPPGLRQQAV